MAAIASIISAIVGALGFFVAWRERALRRGEVLAWANEGINTLQTIALLCDRHSPLWRDPERANLVRGALLNTSVLIERGRLFFRNKPWGDWGIDNDPAYRGLRPVVLDQLVLAHQIARSLSGESNFEPDELLRVADRTRKRFVSLCQQEVGRSRSASVNPAKPGESISLRREIEQLSDIHPKREVRRRPNHKASARPA
jgi:hypothetical protein